MIAKGVRFNAEKKQVGNYYSTKVCAILRYKFQLNYIVLLFFRHIVLSLLLLFYPLFSPLHSRSSCRCKCRIYP